ncbi:MAG: hypothetical protein SH856_12850 [Flavobacteriales bacterium]|nr:hypothetical protein [Flavobacteriales bacterium]
MSTILRYTLSVLSVFLFFQGAHSQNTYTHWYQFISVVPVTPQESKPILELLRIHLPQARIIFSDKNDSFSLAQNTMLDVPGLIDHANDFGFYIADITNGEIVSEPVPERCSVNYQKELWKTQQPEQYASKMLGTIFITQLEFDSLPANKKQSLIDQGNYVIAD